MLPPSSSRGTQISTLLFGIAFLLIVLAVGLFIGGLCWVMTEMSSLAG